MNFIYIFIIMFIWCEWGISVGRLFKKGLGYKQTSKCHKVVDPCAEILNLFFMAM